MEELKYTIEDSTIAELLGVQNFSTDEAAILELVKNAYDAKALILRIEFSKTSIVISDDGEGMTIDDIRRHWMHVGKSDKGYTIEDSEGHTRVLAGSKGIGRFALARLGRKIEVQSKKLNQNAVLWKTDWETSNLDSVRVEFVHGTRIRIDDLRTKWRTSRQKKLIKYLSRMYNDSLMSIVVHVDGEEDEIIKPYFPKAEVGINCRSNIILHYKNGKLNTTIVSDEFSDNVSQYCGDFDFHNHSKTFIMSNEIKLDKVPDLDKDELPNLLEEIGDFSANFYFNFVATNFDKERFLYKYTNTPNSIDEGIVLYRNAFSISSHEGKKDWLGLGKRSRQSPAAATHETGAWRVRENQLSGYVQIDKETNKVLTDMSNRQGLDENIYYLLFIEIILCGLKEFERYRQSIIRKINVKNKEAEETEQRLLKQIVKKPLEIKNYTDDEAKQIAKEISELFKQKLQAKLETKRVEEHYKYDVRILNVLATNGLKVSLVAHEITNNRNDLKEIYTNIIESLKEYKMWDELNRPENQAKTFRNVPYMLDKNYEISKKLIIYLNTMLSEIEKEQFDIKKQNIYEMVESVISKWKRDYGTLLFNVNIDHSLEFVLSEDILQVILDNLILNSIQQNEKKTQLKISVDITKQSDLLIINYKDNGKGLDPKYDDDPMRILEVHETTRKKGHGLGMWIVNNSVTLSGGEVKQINGKNGFSICLSIGGKNA